MLHAIDYLRAYAAVCAGFVATVICIVERHVHVVLSESSTYGNPFEHKCGLLMVGCVGWALAELASGCIGCGKVD